MKLRSSFLERPSLARLSSHNPDGTIHIAPLFFLFVDGAFLFGTRPVSRKLRNIVRDPRISVLVDTSEPILQSVLAYGRAALEHENVLERRIAILMKYGRTAEGARSYVQKLEKTWGSIIIRLEPDSLVTVDRSQPYTLE